MTTGDSEKRNRSSTPRKGGAGTPYNDLYGGAPPERGTVFRLQVKKKVGVLQVEVYERVYSVCKKAQKG